ncbi:MAG: hypothetical protein KAJ01_09160, partial [Candidatus Hydrogenedentes bacterium]|nr:hypothetical protein [Candidatus Hydrogenedentota bacterium]
MKSTLFVPLTILLTLLAAAGSALPTGVSATLAPAEEQDPGRYPYRNAVLTINNDTDREINTFSLRWKQGGPTIRFHRVHIPPDSEWTIAIELPAISLVQTYDLELLVEERSGYSSLAATAAEINWPVKLLT